MKIFSDREPIVALASPWGESAIAVLRISGEGSHSLLERVFKGSKKPVNVPGHTLVRGTLCGAGTNQSIDDVLLAVYKSPASYTGEEAAEIFCHGSLAVIKAALELLTVNGFRPANPGEFTLRAFMNKKMDLTRAEAVNEIIRSRTDKARALALNRLNGSIETQINEIKDRVTTMVSALEVQLDYPEEETENDFDFIKEAGDAKQRIERLLSTYSAGRIIQEGISMVLAGRTNAGKSTLFNLLVKEDRAIVSDVHGTTRDYIEGAISVEGIPVRLFDTAGLRISEEPLEREGMKRTRNLISGASILIYIVDATQGLTTEDEEFMARYRDKVKIIIVYNKIDVHPEGCPENGVPVSALSGKGLDLLNKTIVMTAIGTSAPDASEAVIDSIRQKECLSNAGRGLDDFMEGIKGHMPLDVLAVCLKDTVDALGELTGEVTSEEILEKMFSKFCVGK
ncbi:MAG: tRNA uridine-5-carboxymethylaminomethyl(34) synthesis GTPase MnmE [Spirochaetales bacterium]|nr:tRNA uridine-5-carboxymethylaminomethyl(34) synthesis GTPase MnmE [Spirochaetales bacterium]